MTVANMKELKDEVLTVFKAAWDTTNGGNPYQVKYPGIANSALPPENPTPTEPWAMVTLPGSTNTQSTLANYQGKKRFEFSGPLIISIFAPMGEDGTDPDGLVRELAQLVWEAYAGKNTDKQVWFRDATVNIIGESGNFYQANVSIDFTYDQIK